MKFFNFFRKNLSQKSTVLTKYQFFRPSDNPSLKIHLSFFANLSVNPNSGRVDAKNWGVDPPQGGSAKIPVSASLTPNCAVIEILHCIIMESKFVYFFCVLFVLVCTLQ